MKKRILTIFLALVMVLSFTACTEGEEAESLSVEEIVDRVIEAQKDIRTAQYDMDMTMDMSGESEGESFEATFVMDMKYTLDLEERKMAADIAIDREVTVGDNIEMKMEMYIIEDMMYMMMDVPEMDSMWMKSEMPEEMWDAMNQIEPQIELLSTVPVRVIGSEKVSGVDCYLVELTPDAEQLWQLAMQQSNVAGQGTMLPEVTEDLLKDMFRSFTVKQWVAKDTFLLAKAEIAMDVELTSEVMASMGGEGEMTMDIAMSILAYNYNQSVSIVLPPEAEEAEEIPGMIQ